MTLLFSADRSGREELSREELAGSDARQQLVNAALVAKMSAR